MVNIKAHTTEPATPSQRTAEARRTELVPTLSLTITARWIPPMSACDELDGMPYRLVIAFQAMAPISAPNTTWRFTTTA